MIDLAVAYQLHRPDRKIVTLGRYWRCGQHICIPEAVTLNFFTGDDWQRSAKHWAAIDERMELSVLAAGIGPGREVIEKLLVEVAAHEAGIELFGIDADQLGAQA